MFYDSWNCTKLLYSLYILFYNETDENIEYVKKTALDCGPVGQKLLQFLMMHDGFLSAESKKKFVYIFEECVTHSWEETQNLYVEDFGRHIEEDFEITGLDTIPVGSGTLGQVYKLFHRKMKKMIALKVRHPNVERDAQRLISTINFLLNTAEWIKNIPFSVLIREFLNNIHVQLDYSLEAENTKKIRNNFMQDNHIIIPKVYFSSPRCIAMSYHEGLTFTDIQDFQLRTKVSCDLLLFNVSSMLVYDSLHCDLHYGNWKVILEPNDEYKLIIYDCGVIGTTGNEEANKLICMTCMDGDYVKMYEILVPDMDKQRNGLRMKEYTKTLMEKSYPKSSDRFADFLKQMFLYKIKFNMEYLRCIQGILTCLNVLVITTDKLTKILGKKGNRLEILVCYYHGLLKKMDKYPVLTKYLEVWMEEESTIEQTFYDWLEETFGHRDKDVFVDAIIHRLLLH